MDYNITIDPKKVKGTNISKYSDGYNYASITTKVGDGEYMSVSYEWKGDTIPEFALMAMEIMKSGGNENATLDDVVAFERAANHFKEVAAKMKKKKEKEKNTKCPKCGKMMDECICKDKENSKTVKDDEEEIECTCGKPKEECKCKPKPKKK